MPGSAEQQRRGFEAFQRYQAKHPRTGQANLALGNTSHRTNETPSQYPDNTQCPNDAPYEETRYEDAY
jgi:hypothetical protein